MNSPEETDLYRETDQHNSLIGWINARVYPSTPETLWLEVHGQTETSDATIEFLLLEDEVRKIRDALNEVLGED